MEELENRLKNVWCRDQKLKVNRARFGKEEKVGPVQSQTKRKGIEQRVVVADTSFWSVLVGEKQNAKVGGKGVELPAMEFLPMEDLLNELKSFFVGRLTHNLEPEVLQTLMFMEGWHNIKVSPMGAKLVLLKEDSLGFWRRRGRRRSFGGRQLLLR